MQTKTVRVVRVLEQEPRRILFGAIVEGGPEDGQQVAFHVPTPSAFAIKDTLDIQPDGVFCELPA